MAILEELKLKANGAADQANNIQEAISAMEFGGGGVFIIGAAFDGGMTKGPLDKTWKQIRDALESKICLIIAKNRDGTHVQSNPVFDAYDNPEPEDGDKRYQIRSTDGQTFSTDTENGYPDLP